MGPSNVFLKDVGKILRYPTTISHEKTLAVFIFRDTLYFVLYVYISEKLLYDEYEYLSLISIQIFIMYMV